MLDETIERVVGVRPERATHWGIGKKDHRGKFSKLDHPNAENVRAQEWPIAELNFDVIRERWGTGAFRVFWFDRSSDPRDTAVVCGQGREFGMGVQARPHGRSPQR